MVAKLRSFYCGRDAAGAEVHVPCGRSHVEARFLGVARELGVPARRALDVLGGSLQSLNEPDAELARKVRALLAKASRQEALELLRTAPKFLGTMSVREWETRELPDIRARAALDNAFDALNFPVRFVFDRTRDATAALMEPGTESADDAPSQEQLRVMADRRKSTYSALSAVFWPLLVGGMLWLTYMDSTYGGPIHGRGACVPSIVPAYNIPDANGNSRLPCTCAPLYAWYVEPLLPEGLFEPPKVESQNCGKTMGGERQACDPKTVGGCVWTAEDLRRDPSYWDPPERRLTHWEQQRCSDSASFCGLGSGRAAP
ncbi:unnamed protein product [Prorocentrum cordatum]|uniref:XRE family transcriptional regulator n=1 Tax=Prorocentrum cordatum TaxID=2364126 RepID=A0ABN9RSF1_9DINO|nr:unnamed protein product [Polarella glacialis]